MNAAGIIMRINAGGGFCVLKTRKISIHVFPASLSFLYGSGTLSGPFPRKIVSADPFMVQYG